MTVLELFDSLVPGRLYPHPKCSSVFVERTSCGSLIHYNKVGKIHNPYGAAVLQFHSSFGDEQYGAFFYLDGLDITTVVANLVHQDAITWDRETNIWDDESIVTVALAEK